MKIIQILSSIFPSAFVKIAFNKLAYPQIRKLREREMETMKTSTQRDFAFKGFKIKLYEWKNSGEPILLIHGWEGQAGNFADLIPVLIKNGFSVITFDGPSHGYSSRAKTSFFEFSELVAVLIREFSVRKLISHSFGGVATTYALHQNPDIEIEKYALLTTPDRFKERIEDISLQYSINEKVMKKLIEKLESEYEINASESNVSNYVKTIKVAKALIIHDKNDRVIPIERSKNVHKNWPQSDFEEITGTGHFRILREEKVLQRLVEFMKQ